jgi:hypothetical protein
MASKNKKTVEEDLGFEPVEESELGFEPVESDSIQTMKDVVTTAPQGVTTWADELQAGAEAILRMGGGERKTYEEIYDPRIKELRQGIAEARERSPWATMTGEMAAGIGSAFIPGTALGKFGGVGGMALRGAAEGIGAAETMDPEDILIPGGMGGIAGGAGALATKGIKTLTTQSPERIRAGVLGARTTQFKEIGQKEREALAKEFSDMGLFQKTKAIFDAKAGKWVPKGSTLENVEKPTREKLLERIENAFETTQQEKRNLFPQIMQRPVSNKVRLMSKIDETINNWAKKRSGMAKRRDVAQKEIDDILSDLQEEIDSSPTKIMTVEMLENAKQRLDRDVGKYGTDPLLGKVNDLDELYKDLYKSINDSIKFEVQNPDYEKLNSIQSKLYTAKSDLRSAMAAEPSSFNIADVSSWFKSPETQLDIARAAEISQTPGLKQGLGVLRPVTSEAPFQAIRFFDPSIPRIQEQNRTPQSLMLSPRELLNYKIPRSTQGILEQKDKVIAKLAQSGVAPEMIDAVAHALNSGPNKAKNIAMFLLNQSEINENLSDLFEDSQYKVFDGKFLDPNDKAKAADEISKRDDLDSIQRAKMINRINKFNEVPEGL